MGPSLPHHAPPADPAGVLVIRNRMAIAGWVFMAIWMGVLALMTWVMWRDGPHPSQPAWLQTGALGLFWLVGIPVTADLLARPCTTLRVHADGGCAILRRSAFTREVEDFPPGSIAAVECAEGKDERAIPPGGW